MKLATLIILAAFSLPATAQQQPTPEEINAALQTLQAQRNEEANKVVNLTMAITRLQKQLADAEAKCKPEPRK